MRLPDLRELGGTGLGGPRVQEALHRQPAWAQVIWRRLHADGEADTARAQMAASCFPKGMDDGNCAKWAWRPRPCIHVMENLKP